MSATDPFLFLVSHLLKYSSYNPRRRANDRTLNTFFSYLLQVYIACLAETNNSIELFKIAHRLIDTNCENWLGWYCAGIYYLTIRNFPKSAELLEKSLTKRPTSGLAYMALGHAFSHEREHDQAFNAYLMAEKEMRGLLKS